MDSIAIFGDNARSFTWQRIHFTGIDPSRFGRDAGNFKNIESTKVVTPAAEGDETLLLLFLSSEL
jgi:hypothetical protein